ncbi:MAG: hypothetical protein JO107_13605, partial [Hyphomicrobiales bacterium]|nr:hypothetical protein [Hyphomicrobiales bacterium]MBV8664126.1 hypothetical protein [Hyphomicrobiales bacterium]
PGAPSGAAALPSADNSFFIGDSIADGLKQAAGADGDTLQGRSADHVLDAIQDLDPEKLKGKTIYLSTGASNSPDALQSVAEQIATLKEKGVDPSQIRVLGVGDRADFTRNNVNGQLARLSTDAGAVFTGPLDPANLRRSATDNSDNGVHFADWKRGLAQVSGVAPSAPGAPLRLAGAVGGTAPNLPAGAPQPSDPPRDQWPVGAAYLAHAATGEPIYVGADGTPLPANVQPSVTAAQAASAPAPAPASGSAPDLASVPPKSQWPDGADHVKLNPDGSLSYVFAGGATQPVPGSRATGAPGLPTPTVANRSLLNALPAQQRAEMIMRAQGAVDRINNRMLHQTGMDSTLAQKELGDVMKGLAQGLQVSDDVWQKNYSQFATSPDPNVRLAYAVADATRNSLTKYTGMAPGAIQADIDNKRADYSAAFAQDPTGGETYLKSTVLSASQAYMQKLQTDLAKDPLGRAAQDKVIPDGITPLTDAKSVQTRVAQAQRVADFYHIEPQYLQPQERAQMKKVAAAGGQPMVDLATEIVAGGGDAAPAMFREIGGSAPAFQAIGMLALDPNGDHSAAINDIASYIHALNDPDAKKDVPRFSESILKKNAIDDPLGDATAGFKPDATGRLRMTANTLMGSRAMAEGSDPAIDPTAGSLGRQDFYDSAYNDALGANYDAKGERYGGLTKIGGGMWSGWGGPSQKTVVPTDIKADDFGKVIASISDGDLSRLPGRPYSGGTAMNAQRLQQGSLVALPDSDGIFRGAYGVTLPDPNAGAARFVTDQSGKKFVLDLNDPTLHEALRSRFPQSFLAKAPPKPVAPSPAPSPYRNTPGMIAAASAGSGEPTIPASD